MSEIPAKQVDRQELNRTWWSRKPMAYDWHAAIPSEPGSREWFEEIDRRFFDVAYFAAANGHPFGRWMKPELIAGRPVLEVGCGMGTHAAALASMGADLTAVDLTDHAVEMTSRRFEVMGLQGRILPADAEALPFEDDSFDTVWSWGVIHHSNSFEQCFQEIARVLRPGGHLLLMVYHRPSVFYHVHCALIRGVLMGQLRHKSVQQIYLEQIDGAFARQFRRRELEGVTSVFFDNIEIDIVGQKNELLPIPRSRVKEVLERRMPPSFADLFLSRLGLGNMIVAQGTRRS